VLARRVDVSKQAVGQALGDLEGRGFVEMVPDPADGRARLVRLTASGLAAFDHGRGVLAFYEAALAARVGQGRIDALRDTLGRVLPVLAEWAAGDAPTRGPATTGRRQRR
jgi:DNA-binding MarR family transcriptional regulator